AVGQPRVLEARCRGRAQEGEGGPVGGALDLEGGFVVRVAVPGQVDGRRGEGRHPQVARRPREGGLRGEGPAEYVFELPEVVCPGRSGETDVGRIAAEDLRDVHGKGGGKDLMYHEVLDPHREGAAVIAQIDLLVTLAVQQDAVRRRVHPGARSSPVEGEAD